AAQVDRRGEPHAGLDLKVKAIFLVADPSLRWEVGAPTCSHARQGVPLARSPVWAHEMPAPAVSAVDQLAARWLRSCRAELTAGRFARVGNGRSDGRTSLWNDRGTVTLSRHDEGREFLDLVAGQNESLAIEIDDEWWATTPRPFLLRQASKETILIALASASCPLSPAAIRLQKLLQARPSCG